MKRLLAPFAALRYRDFRLLWIGLFISWIGSQMQIVAIIWHIYQLTNSPFSLAFISVVRFVPLLLFAPVAGIIADKYDRRKVILLAHVISMVGAFLLTVMTIVQLITPEWIYVALVLNSVGTALDSPARQSFIPSLVPKDVLVNALGLTSIMYQTTMVFGPAITGFLLASFDVAFIYGINALSFIAVIVAILFLKPEVRQSTSRATFSFFSLKQGFHFVFTHPLIASTILLDFFATFFASATTLLPIFAKEILYVGPQGLGILYAAPAVGAIVTGLIFSSFKWVKHQGKILLGAVMVYGFSMILFGLSKIFLLSFFALALSGAGDVVSAIIRNAIRQFATPDSMRGRMTSVSMIFYLGGPHLGEVEAGLLAGLIGLRSSVVLGGIATMFLTIITFSLVPKLRNYHGHEVIL